ncbi:meiotic nuclear division protein 1 homolog isoform X2 [Ailuropoda melanoleuca]|uniref:meiotic nuclear division protein 1 homolog isoform X2 n=1 Tax=Ailuropoda melanoleuca TaxID=9646 RepID=UPI001494919A|nr:meiotic nuclear division protein 1 homolog isoform X2 [Ailuropoda melanoleuca]
MSKKKGLSAEEKRARMMEIFFETKDVFQLKDMEKIAPKEKGITAMSVKEVLQSLVDDGMVDCERIGTSNYYWAFPSKALHARKRKLEVLESQLSEGNQKHASLQKSIEKAKIGRHETEERTMLAKELSSLRDQREQLKTEVEKYKECDPQVVEEIRQANKVAKEAANRWTGVEEVAAARTEGKKTKGCRFSVTSSELEGKFVESTTREDPGGWSAYLWGINNKFSGDQPSKCLPGFS